MDLSVSVAGVYPGTTTLERRGRVQRGSASSSWGKVIQGHQTENWISVGRGHDGPPNMTISKESHFYEFLKGKTNPQ